MSINFNRNRTQVEYEKILEISFEDLSTQEGNKLFREHCLTSSEVAILKNALNEDAVDFFFNGLISFLEGIDSVLKQRFSWATVKLYYSIYYFIRATLATKGYAIMRAKSMYRLKVIDGESPFNTRNKKYNTTHEGTINHYRDLFSRSDMLLSNRIGDHDAYSWMMNAREIVNYKCASFMEPECLEIWQYYAENIDTLADEIKSIEDDSYVKCFQEEYAVLGIPIKRLQETISDMKYHKLLHKITDERKCFLKEIIDGAGIQVNTLNEMFIN